VPEAPRSPDTARSILAALAGDAELTSRVTLKDESSGTGPLVTTGDVDKPRGSVGRYRVMGEIARGGVGVVLKSRDVLLGRDVAMKILRDEYAQNPSVLQRFIEEAQIGGQLQHPGIVPIYEMGLHPDSRPFFTMKLIKGRTLSSLLAERANPADDLRRFLRIFEAVCQTLAYTHARRVIHRDLKPSNVMTGTFGEVQVVDWGLGKVLRAEESSAARPVVAAGASVVSVRAGPGAAKSMVGSVMGTPNYMPPEQAQGLVDVVDERTDVFALGAILCEILTGAPPYQGTDIESVLKARKADLADAKARLDACGADGALVALAIRCLSPSMEARPRNAGVVAKEILHYLSSVDERERGGQLAAAQAAERAAQERKARRLTVALAAAVLVTIVVGAGAYVTLALDRTARADASARAAASALEAAALARGKAVSEATPERWKEAVAAARRAVVSAEPDEVTEDVRSRAAKALSDAEAAARESDERSAQAERSARLIGRLDEIDLAPAAARDGPAAPPYAAAFAEYGADLENGTPEETAERLRRTGAPVRIAAALHDFASERRARGQSDGKLPAIVAALDPDPTRTAIRAAGPGVLRKIASSEEASKFPVETALELGRSLLRRDAPDDAVDVAVRLQRRFPGDVAVHVLHADALQAAGSSSTLGAVRDATTLVALRDDSAAAWTRLGEAFAAHGAFPRAESALRRAMALDPKSAAARTALADVDAVRGDWDASIAAATEAVALSPDAPGAQFALGRCLRRRGRYAEALAALRKGFELASKEPRPRERAVESVESVDRLASLAAGIAELKAGRRQPSGAGERLEWAQVCRDAGLYARAADLYAACLAEDPSLTADFRSETRLDAACAAVLAVPRPEGRPTALDEAQMAPRRRQAIEWLGADLDAWSSNFAADPRLPSADVRRRFARWTEGPELAAVRGDAALAALPDAERAEWVALWAGVRDLLSRARE
jgi:serine/threonine-protein kinase